MEIELHTRERTEPAIAVGMWIGLWIGEVLVSVQYWLARAVQRLRWPMIALAGVSLVAAGSSLGTERNGMVRTALLDEKAISSGIDLFQREHGRLPAAPAELVPRYLRDLHDDPWGQPYRFQSRPGGYAIESAGPDRVRGSGDDLSLYGETVPPMPPCFTDYCPGTEESWNLR